MPIQPTPASSARPTLQQIFGPAMSGATSAPNRPTLKDIFSSPPTVSTDPAEIVKSQSNLPVKEEGAYGKLSDDLGDLGIGLDKGILSTLKGMGTLGNKILTGIFGKDKGGSEIYDPSSDAAKKADAYLAPANTAQSIGKGAEQVGEFLIPSGEVTDLEKVLAGGAKTATTDALIKAGASPGVANVISQAAKLGTKIAVRAGESGAIVGIQTGGDPTQTKTAAEIGGAIPAAEPVVSKVADLAGGALKRLGGALSGRGTAVIDEILKDPKSALQGLTGKSMDTLSKDSQSLKNAVVTMKGEAGKEYNRVLNNLQSIYENEGKSFDKGTELNKITDQLKDKFGIIKAGERSAQTGEDVEDAGKLDFESSRFLPKEATVIDRAMNIVKAFKDPLSPKTIESLASKIDKLKSMSPSAIETNSAIHTITSSLRESVAQMGQEAGYQEGADIARNYAKAMDKIENFTGLFKATPEDLRPDAGPEVSKIGEARKGNQPILTDTEKTKIVNDLQTIFSGNKDVDKDVLRNMFGGQEILSRQAGRTMATASEKASTKLGDFLREVIINPLIGPKRIGELAAYIGIAKDKIPQIISKLKLLPDATRASIVEALSRNDSVQTDDSTESNRPSLKDIFNQ